MRDGQQQRRDQQQDQRRQHDVLEPLDQAVDAVERGFADGDDRHAAHVVHARLDQVVEEDVRHEVDRRGGVAQLVEQLQDARLRGHRQRDVDRVDAVALHERRQVGQAPLDAGAGNVAQTVRDAVVEKADDLHAEQFARGELRRELAARFGHTDDHRAAETLGGQHALDEERHDAVRGVLRDRHRDHPGLDDARVVDREVLGGVAEEDENQDDGAPGQQDVLEQALGAGGDRQVAGEGQGKRDQREHQFGAVEFLAEEQRDRHQQQHREQRVERHAHERQQRELSAQELRLLASEVGDHCWVAP